MGKSWFGTQSAPKPYTGPRVVESGVFDLGITGPQAIALLTTAPGLAQWLATPTRFAAGRGATIEFLDGDETFGGSFALLDIPDRVVIVTERHGEIEVRLAFRHAPVRATVTMTCVAKDDREAAVIAVRLRETMARLGTAMRDEPTSSVDAPA